jgi:hypothetical protein
MALTAPITVYGIIRLQLVLLSVCLLLASTGNAGAQEDQRAVRAAYLFNLTKYVAWPRTSRELKICSEADEHTGELLRKILDGKNSEGRVVHVILRPSGAEQKNCAILYLGNASLKKVAEAIQEVGTLPVLTVGDDPQFVHRGGMVGLVRSEDQIQLHVNIIAVQAAGIKMSSRLLSIAVVDHPDGRQR